MTKTIFNNGVTDYKIVIAAEASITEKCVAQGIEDIFKNFGGVEISSSNEYTDGKKIIVGNVDADKTAVSIRASLSETDYTVRFIDEVLYLIGGSDEATAKAWIYFQLNFMQKDMNALCIDEGFIYNSNTGVKSALTINGNDIAKYTIVHYNGYFAKKCANDIKTAIYNKTGIELTVTDDSAEPGEYEILVGKTNRMISKEIRAKYDRPHIYYDVVASNNTLVVMAEGYTTLEMVSVDLEAYLNTMTETDIKDSIISKNIKYYIDVNMIDMAEGADIRVWSWNMYAPYVRDCKNNGVPFTSEYPRGEVMADILASYYPDIIGTNELFNSCIHVTFHMQYSTVLKELSDYYVVLDKAPYDYGKPDETVTPNVKYGMPENILYKKTPRFSFIKSRWRYPHSLAAFHGYHQAIFELDNGKRFIYSITHYGPSHKDDKYAVDHQCAINDMQEMNGGSELLPVVFSGDMWTYDGDAGHRAHTDAGYLDAQKSAQININGSQLIHTCHPLGPGARGFTWGCCDFIFHSSKIDAVKFGIVRSVNTDNSSDHYPLCLDFKLN